MKDFKGTPKTGSNWAININNPSQTLIENVCIIDEGWHLPEVKADACLISAAPDLLAFAIDFIEKVESGKAKSTDSYNKAKEAVRLALGY